MVEQAAQPAQPPAEPQMDISPETRDCYRRAMVALQGGKIPFLVGGAFAFGYYTGIARHTKDFDLFIRPEDSRRALDVLAAGGYQTELTSPVWIGKAFCGDAFVDLIFSGANGIARVDDDWFAHARQGQVLDVPAALCPPEEILWSKAFVMDRYRYDGADVVHLLQACGPELDWPRLLRRFDTRWPVLLSHLILFSFIYPAERDRIPADVLTDLLTRAHAELRHPVPGAPVCQGTLFSRTQYLPDTEEQGYQDGRMQPWGNLSAEDVAGLTADAAQPE